MAKKENKKSIGDVAKKVAGNVKKATGSKITAEDVENWKQKKRASKERASGRNTASANNTLYSRTTEYRGRGAVGKAKYTGSRMAFAIDEENGTDSPRRKEWDRRHNVHKL